MEDEIAGEAHFSNEDVMKNFDGVCAEIARRLGLEVPPR
jgi:hypothetical protein